MLLICRKIIKICEDTNLKQRSILLDLPRPRKRLTELMMKTALETPGEKEQERRSKASRIWAFRFFRSPVEILADSQGSTTTGVRLAVTRLEVCRLWIIQPLSVLSLLNIDESLGSGFR